MAAPDRLGPAASHGEGVWGEVARGDVAPGAHAVYLYALIDGAACFMEADGELDPSVRPIVHRAGPIAALISVVPLSDYCDAEAASRLRDLAWLAPRTMHHAAVLRRAMQCSPVYPAPFATLFASRDSLSAFMLAHARTLGEFFHAVAGMAEWELKASACLDGQAALDALARDAWPDWARLTPGTRYLRLCRDRAGLVAARRAVVHDIAARLAARLQPPATALRRLGFQPGSESGSDALVGRFALLVPASGASALAQSVRGLAHAAGDDGIKLALSGPWPPFSFRPDLPRLPLPAEG